MLLGSEGNDLVNGGDGNDLAIMGAGDDTFVWNPGDDNDTLEGQAGFDTMASISTTTTIKWYSVDASGNVERNYQPGRNGSNSTKITIGS